MLPVSRSLIIVRKGSRHGEDENHITISNSCHAVTASSHFRDLSLSLSSILFFFPRWREIEDSGSHAASFSIRVSKGGPHLGPVRVHAHRDRASISG